MDDNNKPNVVDVTTLVGKFKNRAELQSYAQQLFLGLKTAVEKIQKLEEENKHLQILVDSMVPQTKFIIPDEQSIAEIQLKRLKDIAMERDLTLDETKRFDLLTKNLYLAKGKKEKPKDIEAENITEAELIKLVKKDE